MKNIYLNITKFNEKSLKSAISFLKKNHVLGIPTETVYGLGGNAYSDLAVRRIYKIKSRTKKNPLIIHYYSIKDALKDVEVNENFLKIYKKFCPGPITLIVKKKSNSKISKYASAELQTVGIRFPNHSLTRKLLKKINFPLAMPSANKSKNISPVSAYDVYDEFGSSIKMILDGGESKIGVESTIVDVRNDIKILRPGFVTSMKIKKLLKKNIKIKRKSNQIISPGTLGKHYSPGIPMILNALSAPKKYAFICFGKEKSNHPNSFNLSTNGNLEEAARNLYKILRKIKNLKYKKIYVKKIPNKGIGLAINDRIKRASN